MYEYHCRIVRVVDGDTVDVDIDLGFDIWLRNERVRIIGIDAPETRTRDLDEKQHGLESKAFVEKMLPVGTIQGLVSKGFKGKFGRILGDFVIYQGNTRWDLSKLLVQEGYASVYTE
jgi:micrococcal nuclease